MAFRELLKRDWSLQVTPTQKAHFKLGQIQMALQHARRARDQLRAASADKAASYMARALKSAEGAERHALRRLGEALREGE